MEKRDTAGGADRRTIVLVLGAEPSLFPRVSSWSLVLQIPTLLPLDAGMLEYHCLRRSVPTTVTPFLVLIFFYLDV